MRDGVLSLSILNLNAYIKFIFIKSHKISLMNNDENLGSNLSIMMN
jgi:hypothetical protein